VLNALRAAFAKKTEPRQTCPFFHEIFWPEGAGDSTVVGPDGIEQPPDEEATPSPPDQTPSEEESQPEAPPSDRGL